MRFTEDGAVMAARCLRARERAPVLDRIGSAPAGRAWAPLRQVVLGRWRGFVADWTRAALRHSREGRGFLALGVPEHARDGCPLVSEGSDVAPRGVQELRVHVGRVDGEGLLAVERDSVRGVVRQVHTEQLAVLGRADVEATERATIALGLDFHLVVQRRSVRNGLVAGDVHV